MFAEFLLGDLATVNDLYWPECGWVNRFFLLLTISDDNDTITKDAIPSLIPASGAVIFPAGDHLVSWSPSIGNQYCLYFVTIFLVWHLHLLQCLLPSRLRSRIVISHMVCLIDASSLSFLFSRLTLLVWNSSHWAFLPPLLLYVPAELLSIGSLCNNHRIMQLLASVQELWLRFVWTRWICSKSNFKLTQECGPVV